jgi:hypothetical protein
MGYWRQLVLSLGSLMAIVAVTAAFALLFEAQRKRAACLLERVPDFQPHLLDDGKPITL